MAESYRTMGNPSLVNEIKLKQPSIDAVTVKRSREKEVPYRVSKGVAKWMGKARGVGSVRPGVSDAELQRLHECGVRGVRFNFVKRLVDALREPRAQ